MFVEEYKFLKSLIPIVLISSYFFRPALSCEIRLVIFLGYETHFHDLTNQNVTAFR